MLNGYISHCACQSQPITSTPNASPQLALLALKQIVCKDFGTLLTLLTPLAQSPLTVVTVVSFPELNYSTLDLCGAFGLWCRSVAVDNCFRSCE